MEYFVNIAGKRTKLPFYTFFYHHQLLDSLRLGASSEAFSTVELKIEVVTQLKLKSPRNKNYVEQSRIFKDT
jgi:hypothetical protein